MSYFVCDVEADASSPAIGSMVCFGVVKIDENLDKIFYGKTAPISVLWNPDALKISGFSREEHENFDEPQIVIKNFAKWVKEVNTIGSPIFITDNPAFDWQWINFYFDLCNVKNPFGFSARRIGDLYAGMMKDASKASKWKKFRIEPHNHHPISDALGNAQALLKIKKLGLKIKFD